MKHLSVKEMRKKIIESAETMDCKAVCFVYMFLIGAGYVANENKNKQMTEKECKEL